MLCAYVCFLLLCFTRARCFVCIRQFSYMFWFFHSWSSCHNKIGWESVKFMMHIIRKEWTWIHAEWKMGRKMEIERVLAVEIGSLFGILWWWYKERKNTMRITAWSRFDVTFSIAFISQHTHTWQTRARACRRRRNTKFRQIQCNLSLFSMVLHNKQAKML